MTQDDKKGSKIFNAIFSDKFTLYLDVNLIYKKHTSTQNGI